MVSFARLVALGCAFLAGVHLCEAGKVILDNDFSEDTFPPLLLTLRAPHTEVLGITTVSGNTWMAQETKQVLRFLEMANIEKSQRPPVIEGATYPVWRTFTEFQAWMGMYGTYAWSGAFAPFNATAEAEGSDPTGSPQNASRTTTLPYGNPSSSDTALKGTTAAQWMVEQANRYPGEITIIAAGPLTNLLMAQMLDPTFPSKIKAVVYEGGSVKWQLPEVVAAAAGDAGTYDWVTDFNTIFDPEAASTVFHAAYPKMILMGDVAAVSLFPNSTLQSLLAANNAFTNRYIADSFLQIAPTWDELCAAISIYPELVNKSVKAFVDIDVGHGYFYGRTQVWPIGADASPANAREVEIVTGVNWDKYWEIYLDALKAYPSKNGKVTGS